MPDPTPPGSIDGLPDAAQFMAGLAGADPRMAMVLKMLEASRSSGAGRAEDDAGEDELSRFVDGLQARLAQSEQRFERLRRKTRDLVEAHRLALDRLADLAGALGACGRCWGEDPRCPNCRGRGRPGMVRPDPQLRAELFGRSIRSSVTTEGPYPPDHSNRGQMETDDA